ncbi:Arm DNA-binding domain-containing protein [Legionella pneumophila]|uniref:Arm DNA-binding domain-containing protein n=1 Tax=Legionella pneumophila TaxID=446 RepID=UPI000D058F58|nr:Arm DNA-binding domain-containing protein [Legionella pneumophila]
MLTDAYIKSLKIGDKKRHADFNGLVLELRPTKKKLNKVFIFRFQWKKKPQTITLGNYPSLTLADAHTIAKSHRELLDKGIAPRQKDKEVNKPKPTFQLIAEQWLHKNQHCWKEVTRNRDQINPPSSIYDKTLSLISVV